MSHRHLLSLPTTDRSVLARTTTHNFTTLLTDVAVTPAASATALMLLLLLLLVLSLLLVRGFSSTALTTGGFGFHDAAYRLVEWRLTINYSAFVYMKTPLSFIVTSFIIVDIKVSLLSKIVARLGLAIKIPAAAAARRHEKIQRRKQKFCGRWWLVAGRWASFKIVQRKDCVDSFTI